MLQSDLPLAVRKEAREKVQARLEGRIITTLHGLRVKYQFHKFSDRTALSEFPENVNRGCVTAPPSLLPHLLPTVEMEHECRPCPHRFKP